MYWDLHKVPAVTVQYAFTRVFNHRFVVLVFLQGYNDFISTVELDYTARVVSILNRCFDVVLLFSKQEPSTLTSLGSVFQIHPTFTWRPWHAGIKKRWNSTQHGRVGRYVNIFQLATVCPTAGDCVCR